MTPNEKETCIGVTDTGQPLVLAHSVCRSPSKQVYILTKNENENLAEDQGGYHHA